MSNIENDRNEEQARVDNLTGLIRDRIETLKEKTGGIRGEIVDIRRDFWEDVTVNFEDSAETAETYASMKQQAELLSERERSHRHMTEQLATLERLKRSPYFGRIDLTDEADPGAKPDVIYLGVGSLLDDSGEEYLIYDWRAPVSSVYYDYGPGPVTYETPAGTIRGEMTLKRQYIIRGGEIRSMFDTGVTIGDELLQEVLGKGSDAAMKTIVATIQQEQNAIIRNERARLLIVQGAAGSGKTSAALQRVAYLLYRYRGVLSADQIVLFSPNPMFNSYVSTVLPELGEQNMNQATYQQYLEKRIGRDFALEDPFTQMEYTLTTMNDKHYHTRLDGIGLKSRADFMELMDRYVSQLGESGLVFKSIVFRGQTLIRGRSIAEKFYEMDRSISIPNRLRSLILWLLKELTALAKQEQKKKWVDEAIELLDNESYALAYQELRGKKKFSEHSYDDFDSERNYLAAKVVQEKFKKLRRRVKKVAFLDVPAIYKALYRPDAAAVKGYDSHSVDWNRISAMTLERLEQGVMPYEDATPYTYLKEKLEGFRTHTTVRHLFIDEAQDYSEFQYRYLKRLFPNSKFTLLGDFNQSIFAHSGTGEVFHTLSTLFEQGETERITLYRSYRSTRQIVEFASRIIEGGERIEPFNRNGAEPTLTQAASQEELPAIIAERLRLLEKAGYESVAIICKTAEEAKRISEQLATVYPGLRLIEKETVTFEKGNVIIPSYLAKGVEFDGVIISDASEIAYSRESERKLFYTACTRAMHELHLCYTGQLTPFLR
ncbi:helicase [Paenibacillus sp. 1011MAR3C5]|uniref:RNA polymerase recycling motor HelD n=1 Tax=Paenibacillus sp. 1011MAR3C5 TaxID=1675787 RepID=UPI000E6CC380|nr:RNA polymerase recycling motor HelD [Paenibacillus sp. 1011MAR3C5]RJE89905.1 helicase [Paenibacillus sp. 1011MAR3C5]